MNTAFIGAQRYREARRFFLLEDSYDDLLAAIASGESTLTQRWNWSAIQTIDYLVRDDLSEPPSFSAWLLSRVHDPGIIGHLARRYVDLSTAWIGRDVTEVRAYLDKIGWLDGGMTSALDAAEATFAAVTGMLPSVPHVLYRFFDIDGYLLYVGLTMDPGSRWRAHSKEKPWWHEVAQITLERFPSREAVEIAEIAAIRAERPIHNIRHNGRVPAASSADARQEVAV